MAKQASPKHLADLLVRLAPALRRATGGGVRVALLTALLDGPRTMRDLAGHLMVTPQAITGLIDGLEAEGVLARERHPTDRRKTVIRLADHARESVKTMRTETADALAPLFEGVSKADRVAFAEVSETLLDRLA
jgi:DNA-binding MarR family transcriptional regulator